MAEESCTVIQWFSALVSPITLIITTYIAVQQWRTNQQTLDLQRYDRRLKIYQEVKALIGLVIREGNAPYEALLEFRRSTVEADFLFGPDIRNYIEEVFDHAMTLSMACLRYDHALKGIKQADYDHKKTMDQMHDECLWISHQQSIAVEKFRKDLGIGDDRFFRTVRKK